MHTRRYNTIVLLAWSVALLLSLSMIGLMGARMPAAAAASLAAPALPQQTALAQAALAPFPTLAILSSVEFFEIPHWDAEKRPCVSNRVSARPDAENAHQKVKTLHLKALAIPATPAPPPSLPTAPVLPTSAAPPSAPDLVIFLPLIGR